MLLQPYECQLVLGGGGSGHWEGVMYGTWVDSGDLLSLTRVICAVQLIRHMKLKEMYMYTIM